MLEATNKPTLIEAEKEFLSGDKASFETVFKEYYSSLCRFASIFVNDPMTSEEVVSDVFFKLWVNKNKIVIKSGVKTYLFSMVRNAALDRLNNKENYEAAPELEKLQIVSEEDDREEADEKLRLAQSILEKMPTQMRQVFSLNKLEGLKYKEIAEVMGISVRTVQNHMVASVKFIEKNKINLPVSIFLLALSLQ